VTEINTGFQVCFFADLSAIEPTAETIASLAKAFSGRKLLPSTYQEFGPQGNRMRPRLQSADNEWVLDFDIGRLDLRRNSTSPGADNMGPVEEFTRDAYEMIAAALHVFPCKGRRLSLVTQTLLRDLTPDTLNQAYSRLLNPLRYYRDFPPVAWRSRSIARVQVPLGANDETLNVILTADRDQRRLLFDPTQPPFDSIAVVVDINTFQGNTETRFTAESLPEFLGRAVELRACLLEQLRERLNA
jgi:hypothetical protein